MTNRTEQEVFDDLAKLCRSRGFAHAVAFFCYRDNFVGYKEELKGSDFAKLFSDGAQRNPGLGPMICPGFRYAPSRLRDQTKTPASLPGFCILRFVMRGPDPRIHLFKKMDCRIKSGNDERKGRGLHRALCIS